MALWQWARIIQLHRSFIAGARMSAAGCSDA
jgi:hypothetical protein